MFSLSYLCIVALLVTFCVSIGEIEFNPMPVMSTAVQESPKEGYGFFIDLWEYSLRVDNKNSGIPSNRVNLEPKSMFIPNDASMAHLIPQDASHPLYMKEEKYSKLRRQFLLDHLMLDSINMDDSSPSCQLPSQGVTLSGKTILITKDIKGNLIVGGVPVTKSLTLTDGTKVFLLKKPLFNLTERVREVFNQLHKIDTTGPLGPPLDIDVWTIPPPPLWDDVGKPPAPPPFRSFKPPAPPANGRTENDIQQVVEPQPLAPLAFNRIQFIHPPAPPKFNVVEINALAPPRRGSSRLRSPAPPVPKLVEIRSPAPPPRTKFVQPQIHAPSPPRPRLIDLNSAPAPPPLVMPVPIHPQVFPPSPPAARLIHPPVFPPSPPAAVEIQPQVFPPSPPAARLIHSPAFPPAPPAVVEIQPQVFPPSPPAARLIHPPVFPPSLPAAVEIHPQVLPPSPPPAARQINPEVLPPSPPVSVNENPDAAPPAPPLTS